VKRPVFTLGVKFSYLFRKHIDATDITTDKVSKHFPVIYLAGGKINICEAHVKFKQNTA
jgi:hypothetical protein